MMEKIFGEYANEVSTMIEWVVGKPNRAMGFAYLLIIVNMIATSFREKKLQPMAYIERLFAYTAFIALGNIIDLLAVDAMFQWEGSTQFLICLYIVGREASIFKNYLTARFGIDVPILNQRLEQIAPGVSNDPETLNARIDTLRRELGELEQQKQENPVEEEQS